MIRVTPVLAKFSLIVIRATAIVAASFAAGLYWGYSINPAKVIANEIQRTHAIESDRIWGEIRRSAVRTSLGAIDFGAGSGSGDPDDDGR